jgi:hypothetical protein
VTKANPALDAFAHAARGFCDWCERSEQAAQEHARAAAWLCKLCAAALDLPRAENASWQGGPDIPPLQLSSATANLSGFNGWYYREYFDPHPLLDDESVMGDVGDDLLDTYKDIKRGLILFDEGKTGDACWHWAFLHRIHWGRHAVGAIFALHCMSLSK